MVEKLEPGGLHRDLVEMPLFGFGREADAAEAHLPLPALLVDGDGLLPGLISAGLDYHFYLGRGLHPDGE